MSTQLPTERMSGGVAAAPKRPMYVAGLEPYVAGQGNNAKVKSVWPST